MLKALFLGAILLAFASAAVVDVQHDLSDMEMALADIDQDLTDTETAVEAHRMYLPATDLLGRAA